LVLEPGAALSSPAPSRAAIAAFSGARVAKTLASSTVSQVLTIGQNFLFVPLFISAWSEKGYGEWMSLTALASYLALLDLGGQVYVGNRLAQWFAQGEDDEFRATLEEGVSLYGVICAALLVGAVCMLFLPFIPLSTDAKSVLFWQSVAVALSVVGGVLVTCYSATGRIVRSSVISVVFRILTIGLSVAALLAKCTMPTYSFISAMSGFALTSFVVLDVRRFLGGLFQIRFTIGALRRSLRMLRGSVEYWVYSLAGALNLQGIVLVVSVAAGNGAVALFVTHRAASSLVTYAGGLLRPALWTELTFMYATRDMDRLRWVASVAVRVSTFCAAVTGAAIGVVAPFGYALWTRSNLDLDVALLSVLVLQSVLAAAWSAASWPLIAANRTGVVARWSVVNGILTVGGALACLKLGGGLRTVAFVSLCADIACALIPVVIASAAFLGLPAWRLVLDLLRAMLCAVPFAAAAYLSARYLGSDLTRLLGFGVASALLLVPSLALLLGWGELMRLVSRFVPKRT
jgi:O-antigen/teichoic acid export membrane protein